MSARNPDGRFRNQNKPTVVSPAMVRAQWVETEAARLKREGFSYEEIADQITQVGRAQKVPLTSLPEGIDFPPDYKITPMGCHRAARRALRRAPTLEANEMRQVDTDRCERMYLFLTPGIRQGDPKSVEPRLTCSPIRPRSMVTSRPRSRSGLRLDPVGRQSCQRSNRSLYSRRR
jgi:hypothetical protein